MFGKGITALRNGANGKQAEDVLAAIDKVQAIIWFQPNGTIIDANQNFLAALGYELEEIKGQHHRMFCEPEYASSQEYKDFWGELRAGKSQSGEFKRIAKDGTEIWIESSYNPILDGNGKPIKIVKFAIDVTDKKVAAADAAGQLSAISRSQATIEFELDGTIRTANENFLSVVGYELQEVQGKHHSIFVEPVYAQSQEYQDFWKKLGRGEFDSAKYKRIGKGGKEIWIQATYNPIFSPDGKPYKVVKYATDLTARVNAENQFVDCLKRLSQGDLSVRVGQEVSAAFPGVKDAFNETMNRLQQLVQEIQQASFSIVRATETIAEGARELSQRTDAQAASLQETAATMESMSEAITASASNASQVGDIASNMKGRSERGQEVSGNANEAMGQIEESTAKISEIMEMIDSISIQTNLLALNAAVEAARAGEAGKGFAVVADEVRTLAQNSSSASREISQLIEESGNHVKQGAELVRHSNDALEEINKSILEVVANISEISDASQDQAHSVKEISQTVAQLEDITQRNSSLAEQSAINATELASQAESLRNLVSFFKEVGCSEAA